MLPQVNAQLLRVQAASSGDSAFDTGSEGAGAEKWAGQLEAYYQEKRDRQVTGEGVTRVLVRSLIVATSSAPPVDVGDVLTFDSDAAGTALTGKVSVVERRGARGVPAHVQTTRLTLEAAATT